MLNPVAQQSDPRFTLARILQVALVYKTDGSHFVFLQCAQDLRSCRLCSWEIWTFTDSYVRQVVYRDRNRSLWRLRVYRSNQSQQKNTQDCVFHLHSSFASLSYFETGARTARPGRTPVCNSPSFTTATPFTRT